MSENTNSINRSVIDSMSTADLEAFLELDMQLPDEKQSDAETLLYVTEVLAKRQGAAPKSSTEAFDEFQEFYLPAEDVPPLYDDQKRLIAFPRWVRVAAAAAAIVIVLISGGMTAKAMGFDLWGLIAKWSDEVFFFQEVGEEETTEDIVEMGDLIEVLESYDVDFPAVPHWLPDGYSIGEITAAESPKVINVHAEFECGENSLVLNLRKHRVGPVPQVAEKDFLPVEEFQNGNSIYYFFLNNGFAIAKWSVENWECSLYGPITIDEMKLVIASLF